MKSLLIIWLLAALSLAGLYLIADYVTAPAYAMDCGGYSSPTTCKGDGLDVKAEAPCRPTDTAGRCADKCPSGQMLVSRDPQTGEAICRDNSQVLGAQAPVQAVSTPIIINGFRGK